MQASAALPASEKKVEVRGWNLERHAGYIEDVAGLELRAVLARFVIGRRAAGAELFSRCRDGDQCHESDYAPITKAARATRTAFFSRENSSNGNLTIETFWKNLMSLAQGVSRDFSMINAFIFNYLRFL